MGRRRQTFTNGRRPPDDYPKDTYGQRNAIDKRAGYCFKTAEQIRNAGCQYDNQADVPLSAGDGAEIGSILRQERVEGCR